MKKSNTRHNKKLHHLASDSSHTLNLNRSVPSFADYPDLSSLNYHLKDTSIEPPRDLTATISNNFKPRTHTKAPSKRLALLLDAYADPANKKPNYTIDHLEGSFRDGSLRSPQNANSVNEGLKKSRPVRHSGISNSFKALEFFKSKEFSKMAMSQVMTKNNQKSLKQEEKSEKKIPETYELLMTQPNERVDDEVATKDLGKRVVKSSLKEDVKKMTKSRNDTSKHKSTLRKIKVLYTDASVPERNFLNSSLPQTTKNKSNMGSPSHHFTNSVILGQPRSLLSHDKYIKSDALSPNGRNNSNLKYQEGNNSVQYADYYSYQQPEELKEKHKKNHSFTPAHTRAAKSVKESSSHHSKAISTLTTKPETESNRGGLSVEKSRLSDHRFLLNNQAFSKDSRTGRDVMLSWSTTRRADGSEQRPAVLHNLHEKRGSEREEGGGFNKDTASLTSMIKLEKAFDLFIEENKGQFVAKDGKGRARLEEITKNWDTFIASLDILDREEHAVGLEKRKKPSEVDLKTLKRDEGVAGGNVKRMTAMITNSTSQSALPTEKKVFKRESNIEKCDTGKVNNDLQQTVEKQQSVIEALKNKEKKLMSLLKAIGKRGVDVEKIYKEDVKKEAGSIESLDMLKAPIMPEEETIVSLPRGGLEDEDNSSQLSQSIELFRK